MSALANLTTIIIDTADPASLAAFYQKVTDWQITYSDENTVLLKGDGPISLGFQRIDGYQGPGWPDAAKHSHLDFTTADTEATIKELLAIGAGKPEFQPGGKDWTVLTDPEGHTFCVMSEA